MNIQEIDIENNIKRAGFELLDAHDRMIVANWFKGKLNINVGSICSFSETPIIRHIEKHHDSITMFIFDRDKIEKDEIYNRQSTMLEKDLRNSKGDNKNTNRRAQTGQICEYLNNALFGVPSINTQVYSCVDYTRNQGDMGHLNNRLEVKGVELKLENNDLTGHLKIAYRYDSDDVKETSNDEVLYSIMSLNVFNNDIHLTDSKGNMYLCVVHGVMTADVFNTNLKECNRVDVAPHKIKCNDAIYESLTSLDKYVKNKLYRMESLFHFLNFVSNREILQKVFKLFVNLMVKYEYKGIFKGENGKRGSCFNELICKNRDYNKRYKHANVGKLETNIKLILPLSFIHKGSNYQNRFAEFSIVANNINSVKITSYKELVLPSAIMSQEGDIEDFINSELTGSLIICYGLRSFFGAVQKYYTRKMYEFPDLEKTISYIDLTDIIDSLGISEPYFMDNWSDSFILDRLMEMDEKNYSVNITHSAMDSEFSSTVELLKRNKYINEYKYLSMEVLKGDIQHYSKSMNSSYGDNIIQYYLPFFYMMSLTLLNIIRKGNKKEISYLSKSYPPYLLTSKGLIDYSDDIDSLVLGNTIPNIEIKTEISDEEKEKIHNAEMNRYKELLNKPFNLNIQEGASTDVESSVDVETPDDDEIPIDVESSADVEDNRDSEDEIKVTELGLAEKIKLDGTFDMPDFSGLEPNKVNDSYNTTLSEMENFFGSQDRIDPKNPKKLFPEGKEFEGGVIGDKSKINPEDVQFKDESVSKFSTGTKFGDNPANMKKEVSSDDEVPINSSISESNNETSVEDIIDEIMLDDESRVEEKSDSNVEMDTEFNSEKFTENTIIPIEKNEIYRDIFENKNGFNSNSIRCLINWGIVDIEILKCLLIDKLNEKDICLDDLLAIFDILVKG